MNRIFLGLPLFLFLCASSGLAADRTEWTLWVPSNPAPVKAVFVCPRWGDGARMSALVRESFGERLGVGTMLTVEDVNTFRENHFFHSITNTLAVAAVERRRPELANAPLLLWAHSNAAQFALRCLREIPERVVAYCLFKSAYGHNNDFGTMSPAALDAFGQSIWDENDRITRDYNQAYEKRAMFENISAARKQGALIHVTLVRGTHHVIDGQEKLMLSFFETAMAQRLPAGADPAEGAVKLAGGLEKSGWVHDWQAKTAHPVAAYPAGRDPRQGWWLPTRDYAVLWNDYALNARGTVAPPPPGK